MHFSCTNWQRPAKRQPVGQEPGAGTVPGIDASRSGTGSPSGTCGFAPSSAWVYGCAGSSRTAGGGAGLDDLAGVHDRDVVADVGDHAEVVADDDHRQAGVADQSAQQAEDLGLHRDVEGGRGLVGDQQLRLTGQRQRDADPLCHTAGQLVRVALQHPLGVDDADLAEQLGGDPLGLAAADLAEPADRLGELGGDGEHRVERDHRLLGDHRDLPAADRGELLLRQPDQFPALPA